MTIEIFYDCSDFGSQNPAHRPGVNTIAAQIAADKLLHDSPQSDKNKFMQGFIHARQGRTDLIGVSEPYDAGYRVGRSAA